MIRNRTLYTPSEAAIRRLVCSPVIGHHPHYISPAPPAVRGRFTHNKAKGYSVYFEKFACRKWREYGAGQCLIPKRNGRDIILQRQVLSLGFVVSPVIEISPPQRLYGYFQSLFKADGIGNMPAIHAKTLLRFIHPIRALYWIVAKGSPSTCPVH